jgi:ribosomal protein S18 acetylase RimI-like enzyme
MSIRRLEPADVQIVLDAFELFDGPPLADYTRQFLADPRHHLLMAFGDDGTPVGFVTGVETTHPDKGTEMFLYELSVAEHARRRGIGRALTEALRDLARERGCHGMWVATETDNAAARATYESAGAPPAEEAVFYEWRFGDGPG